MNITDLKNLDLALSDSEILVVSTQEAGSRARRQLLKLHQEIPTFRFSCQIDLFPMEASGHHLHWAGYHYFSLIGLSFSAPSCWQKVNPVFGASAYASCSLPPAGAAAVAADGKAVAAADRIQTQISQFCTTM